MGLTKKQSTLIRGTIFVAAVLLGIVLIGVLKEVPPSPMSFYPKCHFHVLTGLHCPGCGMTRSLHHLLNGRVIESLQNNVLTFIALPLVVVMMFRSLWNWIWDRSTPSLFPFKKAWLMPMIIGIGMAIYGIIRNLPYACFECLRPT